MPNTSKTINTYHFVNRDIYYQEAIDYDFLRPKFLQDSKYKRTHIGQYVKQDGTTKIPLITHQIYFSNALDVLSGLDLKHSVITTNKFNEAADFKHYIWTNDENLIPDELKNINGVEVHLFSELTNFRLFKELSSLLNMSEPTKAVFAEASDVLRIILIREFGGIYHDLDYYLINSNLLLEFLKAFDFIAGEMHEKDYEFISNGFFAAVPGHPVMNEASRLIERNLNSDPNIFCPEYIKYPHTMFSKVLYDTGPGMFSMAYFRKQNQSNNNDILLPHLFLFNLNYIWSIVPESKKYERKFSSPPSLINYDKDGEVMMTIGCNPLKGEWTKNLHTPINYGLNSTSKAIGINSIKFEKIWQNELCPVQVINLDSSIERWSKIAQYLDLSRTNYQRLSAIDGKKVNITNLSTGETFLGGDLKDKPYLHQKNVTYKAICPNDLYESIEFKYNTNDYLLVAGEWGLMCTWKILVKEVAKSNCPATVFLEDDFKPIIANFTQGVNLIGQNIPKDAAIIYLDVRIIGGNKVPLGHNAYVSKFSPKADYWGAHAFMLTKLGARIFDQIEILNAPNDNSLLRLAQGKIYSQEKFNSYVAADKFSRVNSWEYSGINPNSEISKTGCRTSLRWDKLKCTNDVPVPIETNSGEVLISGDFLEPPAI